MRRRVLAVALASVCGALAAAPARGQAPLRKIGELDVPLLGLSATLDPLNPVVPKNTASGVRIVVNAGGRQLSAAEVAQFVGGSFVVQAELSGPGLPGTVGLPLPDDSTSTDSLLLRLPALTTAGDYALSNIRLVAGGRTVLDTTPADVTVNVIDQVLVTSVKTQPLPLDQIKALGIVLDDDSYQGFSFTLGMKVDSKAVSFSFPVVFNQAGVQVPQPLLPPPEPPVSAKLPPMPPVTVVPMLLGAEGGGAGGRRPLVLPGGGGPVHIPAILVIPGNVGYLKQFFSAQLFVANGAPVGSGLVVRDVAGTIHLPPGPDQVLGSPDDPLSLPATTRGPQPPTQPVKGLGPDGVAGTPDDTEQFAPGEQGLVEFAIRAEKEGFFTIDFDVNAVLEGLPVGPVHISGKASGGVLVRNPYFNMTFTVPSVVRTGERFHLYTTVTNIGQGIANDLTVSLDQGAISGATLVGSPARTIPMLQPGDSKDLDYEFKSLRTGQVVATYLHLDTADGSTGKLQFTLGVGERGIPLSPDTLVLPTAVTVLPASVVDAAMRVLGQAWSIANAPAGTLPAGVTRTSKSAVTKKTLALAEAGLRVTLGQTQADAVRDLALDFFVATPIDPGFDQLLRQTEAGHALAIAVGTFLNDPTAQPSEDHASGDGVVQVGGVLPFERRVAQLAASGPDFISFAVGSGAQGSSANVWLTDALGRRSVFGKQAGNIPDSQIPGAVLIPFGDPATAPVLGIAGAPSASPYNLWLTSPDGTPFDVSLTMPRGDGTFVRGTLTGVTLQPGVRARIVIDLSSPEPVLLQQDPNGDGTFPVRVPLTEETLAPQGPTLVSATVIGPSVLDGAGPHGMQAVLVFDRVVDAGSAGTTANYVIPDNAAFAASRQLSGRLVIMALTTPEGPYVETTVSANDIADLRGATSSGTVALRSLAQGPGAVVTGRVLKADGVPLTSGSVTYTNDSSPADCANAFQTGLARVPIAGDGRYALHYVSQGLCGLPFEVITQDPLNGETRKASTRVLYGGQALVLDITLVGRGAVSGTVYDLANNPVPAAHVTALSAADLQSGGTAVTDIAGRYTIGNLAVGQVNVTAALGTALGRSAGRIERAGTTDTVDVILNSGAVNVQGVVSKVENAKSSPAPAALVVYNIVPDGALWPVPVGYTYTGPDGKYSITSVPAGKYVITAAVDQVHTAEMSGTSLPGQTIVKDLVVVFQPSESYGTVSGTVRLPSGAPASGAIVTIGGSGVLTDGGGQYTIPNVAVMPNQAQPVRATTQDGLRSGSATVIVNVPGELLSGVDIALSGLGSVQFVVQDPSGKPIANQPVSLFGFGCEDECGCGTKTTDPAGLVRFDGFPVGAVTAHAIRSLVGGGTDEVRSAASITKDGDVGTGLLKFAGAGSVTGTVLAKVTSADSSWQGVLGATVVLRANHFVHDPNDLICGLVGGVAQTIQTDAQGHFSFAGVNLGGVSVTATQDFYPNPSGAQGNLGNDGQTVDFTLKLVSTISGVLKGTVYLPDGITRAGAGVQVTANGPLPDVTVSTNADGEYHFARIFPAGAYTITAKDPDTGGVHRDTVYLQAGQDVTHDIRLKGRGTVTVTVVDALGAPVTQAYVRLTEAEYPQGRYEAALDASTQGVAVFSVFEGPFTVEVRDVFNAGGRASSSVPAPGSEIPVRVSLSVTGTVQGHFRMPDGVTPIPSGTVTLRANGAILGQISTPATGDVGSYSFDYVPAGDIRLDAEDPLTGRTGFAFGRVTSPQPPVMLDVLAQALGTVRGTVTLNGSPQGSARVHVVSQGYDAITYSDSQGQYAIDGVPAGRVVVTASLGGGLLAGSNAATLATEGQVLEVDVALRNAGSVKGTVVSADNVTPAPLSLVKIQVGDVGGGTITTTTDAGGAFAADLVPAGAADISVQVLGGIDQGRATATVTGNETVTVPIVLNGVGSIVGHARDSQGNPASGSVSINGTGPFAWSHYLMIGDTGEFELPEVLAGPFTASLRTNAQVPLYGTASDTVAPGQKTDFVITLQPSATVKGRVLRSDGATPAFGAWVTLTPATGGSFRVQVGPAGTFRVAGVPLGKLSVAVSDPITTGVARLLDQSVTVDGGALDLGDIVEDDHPPTLAFVTPAEGSTQTTVGGPLVLSLGDVGSGLDLQTLTVTYPSLYVQGAASFAFDAGQARAVLTSSVVGIGTNTLTARVADLAGNVTTTSVTFTVTGGTITGHVQAADGSNAAGVSVKVDGLPPVSTKPDGSYLQSGLRPGSHTVTATDPVTGVPVSQNAYLYDGDQVAVDFTLPAAGHITGFVRHPGGAGAADLTVTYSGPGVNNLSKWTVAGGFFDLGPLPLGTYTIHAFDPATTDQGDAPPPLTLSSPGQLLEVTIVLNGVGHVSVGLRDASGQTPIADAPVYLTSSSPYAGSYSGRTDSAGKVSFANVLAGTITAHATDPATGLPGEDSGSLVDGGTLNLDVRLKAAGRVVGTVSHHDGSPAKDVTVTLSGAKSASTTTKEDGQFAFEVVPLGTFSLDAKDPDQDRGTGSGALLANGDTATVPITLNGLGAVTVTVSEPSGDPVDAGVTLTSGSPFGGSYSGRTGSGGTISFPCVLAGPLNVTAVVYNPYRTGHATGSVAPDGTATLAITLQGKGSISGRVFAADGHTPVQDAVVSAWGAPTPATSDVDGNYTLSDVALGTYTLEVRLDGRLRARVPGLTITDAQATLTQDVTLVAAGTVTGTLKNAAGALVAGATVTLSSTTPYFGGYFPAETTDANGVFTITGVPQGSFSLTASKGSERVDSGGEITADKQVVTLNLQMLSNAVNLPTSFYDGNMFQWTVYGDGTLSAPWGNLSPSPGRLSLTQDGTTRVFAGSGDLVASELGRRQVVLEQTGVGSLRVIRRVFVPIDGYFVRYVDVIENPGGADATVDVGVDFPVNSGWYPDVQVVQTASADALSAADAWFTLDDSNETKDVFDGYWHFAPFSFVASGANGTTPSVLSYADSTVHAQWNAVTVPAGSSRALLYVLTAQGDRGRSAASAARLTSLPPELLVGLTPQEAAAVLNFALPADLSSTLEPLRNDGIVSGRALAGDGQTPVTGTAGSPNGWFKSRSPYVSRPVTFQAVSDGSYLLRGEPTRDDGGKKLIPRAPFDLAFTYNQPGPATAIAAGDFPATGTIDLTSVVGRTVNASSAYPHWCCVPTNAVDGDLETVWQTNNESANQGQAPYLEVVLPGDATISAIKLRGRRDGDYYAIQQARLEVRDASGTIAWSQVVDLPAAPYRDADVAVPGVSGRSVRIVDLKDASSTPGIAEIQVIGQASLGRTGRTDVDAVFEGTGILTGQVLRADGSPVAGGSIDLSDGSRRVTRTPDGNGGFTFLPVPAGSYTLTVTHPLGSLNQAVSVSVASGVTTTANVVYPALGSIHGTLRTSAGLPIYGSITVTGPNFSRSVSANGQTGSYLLADVPIGVYTVTATDNRSQAVLSQPVSVAPGPAPETDFTFPPVGKVQVTVRLSCTDSSCPPVKDARVFWSALEVGLVDRFVGYTDVTGQLTASNVPGAVTLRAEHPQQNQAKGTATATIASDGATVSVTIAVPNLATLSGTLRSRSGAPYDPAAPGNYGATVTALDQSGHTFGGATVDASGRFQIANVPVGPVWLRSAATEVYGPYWFSSTTDLGGTVSDSPAASLDALVAHGRIATRGQRELWAFDVQAGEAVTLFMVGAVDGASAPLADPYLEIRRLDASVVAQNDNREASDLNSTVTFTVPEAGTYVLVARAAGNQVGGYRLGNWGLSPTLRAFSAPAQVTGHVTRDSDGQPAVGAKVRLVNFAGFNAETVSDPNGGYSLPLFPLGAFEIQVVDAEDVVVARQQGEITTEGEAAAVDLVIPVHESVTVTVHRGDTAVVGISVALTSDHPGALTDDTHRTRTTDAAGKVSTWLPVGQVAADVVDPYTGTTYGATQLLAEGARLTLDVAILQSAAVVTGTVRLSDGATALPGATVAIPGVGTRMTDSSGEYRFDAVPPGSYTITAAFGSSSSPKTITASGGVLTVDFQLTVAALTGQVKDSFGGVAGASVQACGYEQQWQWACTGATSSGDAGRYVFAPLPAWKPGQIVVSASLTDGSGLSAYSYFTYSSPTVYAVDIVLPPTGSVTGTVRDVDGSAVGGASVQMSVPGYRTAVADAAGRFRIWHVTPGAAYVYATDPQWGIPGAAQGTVMAGQELTLDVTLVPAADVAGVLLDGQRQPLAGGSLTVRAFDVPAEWSGSAPVWPRSVATGEDGSFQAHIPAGLYQVFYSGAYDESICQLDQPAAAEHTVSAGGTDSITLVAGDAVWLPQVLSGSAASYGEHWDCSGETKAAGFVEADYATLGLAKPAQAGQSLRALTGTHDSGLRVRQQVFVPSSGAFSRTLTLLTNGTAAPLTGSVEFRLRLGDETPNDVGWTVLSTSAGASQLDPTTAWGVLRHPQHLFNDAAIVIGDGSATALGPVAVQLESGGAYPEAGLLYGHVTTTYEVTVPAGETRAILSFSVSRPTGDPTGITVQAQALASLRDPNALAGLTAAERAAIVNFALPEVGQLTVTVTDGSPVAGAAVGVFDGTGQFFELGQTDALGVIVAQGLRYGEYSLVVSQAVTARAARAFVTIDRPASAVTVPLEAIDTGTVAVHGTWATSGGPAAGATLIVHSAAFGDLFDRAVVLDASGDGAVTGMPAGAIAVSWGAPLVGETGTGTLAPGSSVTIATVGFASGTLDGHVYAGDGETPLASSSVQVLDADNGTVLGSTTTDGDGHYAVPAIRPGRSGFFVRVTWRAAQPAYDNPGGFAYEGEAATLDLRLPIAVMKGTVSYFGGSPVAYPSVFVTQADASDKLLTFYAYSTTADGGYVVLGASTSDFELTAQDGVYGLTTKLRGTVTDVTAPLVLPVALPATGTVTIEAYAAGAPVSWAGYALASAEQEFDRTATAGSATSSFDHVPLGNYLVQAADSYSSVSTRGVLAAPDEIQGVRLDFPASSAVSGKLKASDGTPVGYRSVLVIGLDGDGPWGRPEHWNTVDSYGDYSVTGIPVGPVRIIVPGDNSSASTPTGGYVDATLTTGGLSGVDVTLGNAFDLPADLTGTDGFGYQPTCDGTLSGEAWTPLLRVQGRTFGCQRIGLAEIGGRGVSLGPSALGTLVVTRKVFVPTGGGFARYLEILTNPGPAPATARVEVDTAFVGGDTSDVQVSTHPRATSNTYAVAGNASWAAGYVFAGPDGSVGASVTGLADRAASFEYHWNVTVPPGGTVALMHFAVRRSSGDSGGAETQAQALVSLGDPNALTGLSAQERAAIVNFQVPP